MRFRRRLFVLFLNCGAAVTSADAVEVISLALPVRCELGATCFVQNYVDHDATGKALDYHCAGRTYDGHDGTDIRVPDLAVQKKGMEVIAAAPGRVVGTRDGMDDVSVRVAGKAAIAGRECGNGAVVEHEGGWVTQYCHMAKGSLRVKAGDQITTGQPIGLIGLSGETEFPHLHFSVRYLGRVVDPFAYDAPANSCNGGRSLWDNSIHAQTDYRAGEILNFGFAGMAPTMDLIESGEVASHPVTTRSEVLAAYVRAIGLQAGDQQILTVANSSDTVIAEHRSPALDRDKAQVFLSAGRKRREAIWPAGTYVAKYRVMRYGVELLRKTFEIQLDAR